MLRLGVRWLLAVLLAAGLMFPAAVFAQQPCNQSSSNEDFTLTPTQGTYLAFPSANVSDFSATWTVVTRTYSLYIDPKKKNRNWDLCIRAGTSTLQNGKPIADMEWRLAGTTTWFPLTTAYSQVYNSSGARTVNLEFRIRLYWAQDLPAQYGTLFTLAAL